MLQLCHIDPTPGYAPLAAIRVEATRPSGTPARGRPQTLRGGPDVQWDDLDQVGQVDVPGDLADHLVVAEDVAADLRAAPTRTSMTWITRMRARRAPVDDLYLDALAGHAAQPRLTVSDLHEYAERPCLPRGRQETPPHGEPSPYVSYVKMVGETQSHRNAEAPPGAGNASAGTSHAMLKLTTDMREPIRIRMITIATFLAGLGLRLPRGLPSRCRRGAAERRWRGRLMRPFSCGSSMKWLPEFLGDTRSPYRSSTTPERATAITRKLAPEMSSLSRSIFDAIRPLAAPEAGSRDLAQS